MEKLHKRLLYEKFGHKLLVKLTPDFVDTFYITIELKRFANLSVSEEVHAEGFQEVLVILVLIDVVLHGSNTKKTISKTTNGNK